jgi:hypothetical protein
MKSPSRDQDDFAAIAALHQGKGLLELTERESVRNERGEIESA